MALDDYRMLAPQRQIGEPSSLENVIAQAMMSKLSPEMMQGYYLQARGQRQRQAADFGAQQAIATGAGLAASDRTADYELLGKAIANPNAASAFLPKRVSDAYLTPGQGEVGQAYTGYHLGKVAAEGRQANASAEKTLSDAGYVPIEFDTNGIATKYSHAERPDLIMNAADNATSRGNNILTNQTNLQMNANTTGASRANTADTLAYHATNDQATRDIRMQIAKMGLGKDQNRLVEKAVADAGRQAGIEYDRSLEGQTLRDPVKKAANRDAAVRAASQTMLQSLHETLNTPVAPVTRYDPGDPLAGVPAAAAGGNAASGLPASPAVVQPSPAAPASTSVAAGDDAGRWAALEAKAQARAAELGTTVQRIDRNRHPGNYTLRVIFNNKQEERIR